MAEQTTQITDLPVYTPPEEEGQQQIISTQPQNESEVNVVDYYGVQAGTPTVDPSMQLGTQISPISIDEEKEIQTYKGLDEEADVKIDEDLALDTVEKVTEPSTLDVFKGTQEDADLVDEPDFVEATAQTVYTKVDEEANKLNAAKLELEDVDPLATVAGQMAMLQEQFADGETPIWAQGAMRTVKGLMAQRGIGGSTMAAEAITNALLQSTIDIAQQDASFYQTVSLSNLANEQQTELDKFNSRVSAIFNDQAAENAAENLNAQSENELNQFFAELSQQVALANSAAADAMSQFNATTENQAEQFLAELKLSAEQINADIVNDRAEFDAELTTQIMEFNASMKNNREQFDTTNQMAIDASNVQWRRDVNTANTTSLNAAIQFDVQNLLGVQQTALNNIWNHYDTLLNMAWKSDESALDRSTQIAIATLQEQMRTAVAEAEADGSLLSGIFTAGANILTSQSGSSVLGKILGWG